MYPGQFPNIRLNLFNVVLVLDLSQTSALQFITGSISNIINRTFPIRFGLVPITETERGKYNSVPYCHVTLIVRPQEHRWRGFSTILSKIMVERQP